MWEHNGVTDINLNGQQLQKFPFKKIPENTVECLYLDYNIIKKIPSEISKLFNLNVIYLNNNLIKKIPSEISKLQNLHTLWIGNNLIKKIPFEYGQLQNLYTFWIDNNLLLKCPENLYKCDFLHSNAWGFNINNNKIKKWKIKFYEKIYNRY